MRFELAARDNVGFGDIARLTDDAAIRTAAARSGADVVVAALPRGYDTVLGRAYDEAGQDLSIGQWQKLAIARAYMRDAQVLVDAKAEVEVYRRFAEMARGKSVLLISHRLGATRLADRILVLRHGRVVEEGTHAELVAGGVVPVTRRQRQNDVEAAACARVWRLVPARPFHVGLVVRRPRFPPPSRRSYRTAGSGNRLGLAGDGGVPGRARVLTASRTGG